MQRVPEYLYRILRERDGRWLVSAYLEEQQAPHTTQGPTARFSDEALPDWIRKDIALLSMVDEMGEIKSIGHRIGNAFWLVSENSKHLVKKRQVIMDMAQDKMDAFYSGSWDPTLGEIK